MAKGYNSTNPITGKDTGLPHTAPNVILGGQYRNAVPDLSTWMTKQQVASMLRVSEKTVTRMAARGELKQETLNAPGQTPRPVFEPETAQRAARTLPPDGPKLLAAPAIPDATPKAKPLPLSELRFKTFLTTDEAVRYSGLPEPILVSLVERGALRRLTNMKPYRYSRIGLEDIVSTSCGAETPFDGTEEQCGAPRQ